MPQKKQPVTPYPFTLREVGRDSRSNYMTDLQDSLGVDEDPETRKTLRIVDVETPFLDDHGSDVDSICAALIDGIIYVQFGCQTRPLPVWRRVINKSIDIHLDDDCVDDDKPTIDDVPNTIHVAGFDVELGSWIQEEILEDALNQYHAENGGGDGELQGKPTERAKATAPLFLDAIEKYFSKPKAKKAKRKAKKK